MQPKHKICLPHLISGERHDYVLVVMVKTYPQSVSPFRMHTQRRAYSGQTKTIESSHTTLRILKTHEIDQHCTWDLIFAKTRNRTKRIDRIMLTTPTGVRHLCVWIFSKRYCMVCFITGCPPLVRLDSKACCFLLFLARPLFSASCMSRSRCFSSVSCLRWSAVSYEKNTYEESYKRGSVFAIFLFFEQGLLGLTCTTQYSVRATGACSLADFGGNNTAGLDSAPGLESGRHTCHRQ